MAHFKIAAGAALVSVLLLGGCTLTGSSNSGTVNPALQQEDVTFFNESGAVGCATGALIGGLLGALVADSDKRAQGVLIGAAAGCGVGITGNYILNKVRANYNSREQQLDYMTGMVKEDNEKLTKLINNVQATIDDDKAKIAKLNSDLTAGKVKQDDLKQQKADMAANYEYMQKNAAEIDKRIQSYQDARTGIVDNTGANAMSSGSMTAADRKALAQLDEQIAALQRQKADLSAQINEYASLRNAVGVAAV